MNGIYPAYLSCSSDDKTTYYCFCDDEARSLPMCTEDDMKSFAKKSLKKHTYMMKMVLDID